MEVHGECAFLTAGYSAVLRCHRPQGINLKDLRLDLVIPEPPGQAPQVITTVAVDYSEETEFEYGTVTILPDGPTVPV